MRNAEIAAPKPMNNQINNDHVGLNLPPPVVDPDDPLLIAQTLTYVTDDGSVLLSFTSATFSFGEHLFRCVWFIQYCKAITYLCNAVIICGNFLCYQFQCGCKFSSTFCPPSSLQYFPYTNAPTIHSHNKTNTTAFKFRFFLFEAIFVAILIALVPIGAHGTVVSISIGNMCTVAWFWYNSVRCVDITSDGGLRFWIGNIEIDVPYDKIVGIHRLSGQCGLCSCSLLPHRGLLTNPTDGVAILTSVPSTPFWAWPRSAGRPERSLGPLRCPRLKIVFSPAGGGLNFIREVENEMHHKSGGGDNGGDIRSMMGKGKIQPPSFDPASNKSGDFFDV